MERQKNSAFLLRMSPSVRLQAAEQAAQEGLSLNQFISMAVAEKLVRLDILRSSQSAKPSASSDRGSHADVQALRRLNGSYAARAAGAAPGSGARIPHSTDS